MLISDTIDVLHQQQLRIGKHKFKIEVRNAESKIKESANSSIPEEKIVHQSTSSNKYRPIINDSEHSQRQFRNTYDRINERNHEASKIQPKEPTLPKFEFKTNEDRKNGGVQNSWKQRFSSLVEGYFEKTDRSKRMRQEEGSTFLFNRNNEKDPLNRLESNMIKRASDSSQASTVNNKSQEGRDSRFNFCESFKQDLDKNTIVMKENNPDFFLSSPLKSEFSRNRLKKSAELNEINSILEGFKKVKKNDPQQEQKAHDKIEKTLKDRSPEPLPILGKKSVRRKRLFIDEDESPPNFGGSQGDSETSFNKKPIQEEQKREASGLELEAKSPEFGNRSPYLRMNEEGDDNKSTGSGDSMFFKSPASKLSDNQLKRLKKLVCDKREAVAKHSLDKSNLLASPAPKEVCSVCLSEIAEEIGRLNRCVHAFCFTCINDWAKVANECPLCRVRFNTITRYSTDNVKQEVISVQFKRQVTDSEIFEEEFDDSCYKCRRDNDAHVLLICDQCKFYCCHIYCCDPPLESVPEGDWICVFCQEANEQMARTRASLRANTSRLRRENDREQSFLDRLFERPENNSNSNGADLAVPAQNRRAPSQDDRVVNEDRQENRQNGNRSEQNRTESTNHGLLSVSVPRNSTNNNSTNEQQRVNQNPEPARSTFNRSNTADITNLESYRMNRPTRLVRNY